MFTVEKIKRTLLFFLLNLFHFFMCVWYVYVFCMCVWAYDYYVLGSMWRPKVDIRNLPLLLFYLVLWSRVSQSNTGLEDMACSDSQMALGTPHLQPLRLEPQAGCSAHPTFPWVLGIWTPVLTLEWHVSLWAISPASECLLFDKKAEVEDV